MSDIKVSTTHRAIPLFTMDKERTTSSFSSTLENLQNALAERRLRRDTSFRGLRDSEMKDIRDSYARVSLAQKDKALDYLPSFVGTLFTIMGAAIGADDSLGKVLTAAGGLFDGVSKFKTSLTDGNITRLQATLEQFRSYYQTTQNQNDELNQMLNQAERLLDEAIAKQHRNKTSSFLLGS